MSDMKCPICNKPMKQATYDYDKKDNDDTLYMSIMPCDCVCNFAASKAVWQELIHTKELFDIECAEHEMCHTQMLKTTEKLERTRKALDVAKERLKNTILDTEVLATPEYLASRAKETLAEITALEQKDVK